MPDQIKYNAVKILKIIEAIPDVVIDNFRKKHGFNENYIRIHEKDNSHKYIQVLCTYELKDDYIDDGFFIESQLNEMVTFLKVYERNIRNKLFDSDNIIDDPSTLFPV